MKNKIYLIILILTIGLYVLLSFKNPFSPRSLIGNLEPYPDTLYYAAPAWNFVHGNGFAMKFNQYQIKQVTPPLYSMYLAPFFNVFNDVRSFYLANQILMLSSIFIFFCILKLFFKGKHSFLALFLGILLVTNFYMFTFPSLLMAENITLPLFLMGLYILFTPLTQKKTIIGGVLGTALMFVKFSNVTLAIIFYLFFSLKVFGEAKSKSKKTYISFLTISALIFMSYIWFSKILIGHKNLQSGAGFSFSYFPRNINFYVKVLMGAESPLLWYSEKFGNILIFIMAIIGSVIGLASKVWRKKVFISLSFILSLIVFMSFFITPDARYLLAIFPITLILAGIGLLLIFGNRNVLRNIVICIILIAYFCLHSLNYKNTEPLVVSLKKQIGLNFRHKEDPWYFNAMMEFNSYFKDFQQSGAYLGTVLPPFFVSFYSNNTYHYLPLTHAQEFFNVGSELNKEMRIPLSVTDYYLSLIQQGKKVFISNVYINNLNAWKKDYEIISGQFKTTLVKEGCSGACNIYELSESK